MKRQTFVRFVLLFIILVAGMLAYVWEQVTVTSLKKEIDALYLQKQKLIEEKRHLQTQIARLSGASRVKKIASEKLGMFPPDAPPEELLVELRE
ncbi:MAG: cell division protein FtsL [Candidatus Latescibacteria bacterium 4484_181]|nr:MAG: cell division protein FtsL [Candidatus Latescibacteria bacterium 4484_181]RKY69722.1 MAG: cell division protein FtsL [Candidatus Latescibacterota bacterium]RKY73978.1 MAG: cell division protein FtsL [Candidatus Latescibacterota bacterium]